MNNHKLENMKKGGKILANTLSRLKNLVKEGVTGSDLNKVAHNYIISQAGKPAFLNFKKYPASICVSVNDALVHGLPDDIPFKQGDLVGIDGGVLFNGWNVDSAITVPVGLISDTDQTLLKATQESLNAGIQAVKAGVHLGDVQHAIQIVIEKSKFGLVKSLSGHGIGKELHEPPSIPNFGNPGEGVVLQEGMTICLEPMLTTGSGKVVTDRDGWTIRSYDGSNTAHFEHTIYVRKNGAEILTL